MNRELERNPRKALGKGLSALLPPKAAPAPETRFPAETVSATAPKPTLPEHFEEFQSIPLDQIEPSGSQPRESFSDDKLQELSQSIQANGLIQPITVSKIAPGKYRIIAGERRWRAARIAGLTEIPALVRSVEKEKLLELALIENIQREDLNPIEIATAFQRLATEHGLSHEQIAERTGKERSTITNFVRLLRLSPSVRQEVIVGRISMGHARALLNLTNEAQQVRACQEIIDKQLSVRLTESFVKLLTQGLPKPPEQQKREPKPMDPNVRAALDEMALALGTKVRLIPKSAGAGKIEIEYYSQDDLDRIYSAIVKE
ncbi:MAG TPA: ParB/RepB/Spo0J family partition protein [Bryobacteraceae bacterium]